MNVTDELVEAFLNGNEEFTYFLNRKTKEIMMPEAISGEPKINDNVLVPIPQMTSSEAYDLMVEFAKNQEAEVSRRLIDALNRKKPVRSFKDQIRGQEIEQAWYEYENDYARRKMSAWIEHAL